MFSTWVGVPSLGEHSDHRDGARPSAPCSLCMHVHYTIDNLTTTIPISARPTPASSPRATSIPTIQRNISPSSHSPDFQPSLRKSSPTSYAFYPSADDPFYLYTLALDPSPSAVKRLIQTFSKAFARPSAEADRQWRQEARLAEPHELGMTLRRGLARAVRWVGGHEVWGLV